MENGSFRQYALKMVPSELIHLAENKKTTGQVDCLVLTQSTFAIATVALSPVSAISSDFSRPKWLHFCCSTKAVPSTCPILSVSCCRQPFGHVHGRSAAFCAFDFIFFIRLPTCPILVRPKKQSCYSLLTYSFAL